MERKETEDRSRIEIRDRSRYISGRKRPADMRKDEREGVRKKERKVREGGREGAHELAQASCGGRAAAQSPCLLVHT